MEPNILTVESTSVQWRPTGPRHFLDQAVARALGEDHDDGHDCD